MKTTIELKQQEPHMKKAIDLNEAPENQGDQRIYGFTVAQILYTMRTLALEVSAIKEKDMLFARFAKEACELTDRINELHDAATVKEVVEKEKKGLIKSKTYAITEDGFKRTS